MKYTSKMGTSQLASAILANKFDSVEEHEKAVEAYNKRLEKAATKSAVAAPIEEAKPAAKTPKKPAAPKKPKEEAPKTEEAPAEITEAELYPKGTISGIVRRMIRPKEEGSRMSACTFGEASKAVEKKFGRALHPSEFDRNYKFLLKHGIVDSKRPPRFKQDPGDAEPAAETK